MSLPTRAYFFNSNDEVVHSEFTNCGWFVTNDALERCILELSPCPCEFDYVILYELKFPKRFIQFKENFETYSEFQKEFNIYCDSLRKVKIAVELPERFQSKANFKSYKEYEQEFELYCDSVRKDKTLC